MNFINLFLKKLKKKFFIRNLIHFCSSEFNKKINLLKLKKKKKKKLPFLF